MAITRINHFEAKAGSEQALFAFLQGIVGAIQSAPGCQSVKVLRSTVDAKYVAVIEEWETVEHHQAAAKAIPREKADEVRPLLAKPPNGMYFA
jgi:heme-degrading monooxygenase HmoA